MPRLSARNLSRCLAERLVSDCPKTSICPHSGVSTPEINPSNVDLPEPDGPTRAARPAAASDSDAIASRKLSFFAAKRNTISLMVRAGAPAVAVSVTKSPGKVNLAHVFFHFNGALACLANGLYLNLFSGGKGVEIKNLKHGHFTWIGAGH